MPSPSKIDSILSSALRKRLSIDPRSIAVFRIGLALVVLIDLALRSRYLKAFYTDSGVLTLSRLFADYSDVYSVHAVFGTAEAQALLFLITGVLAILLLIGFYPRLCALGTFLLIYSLHARNPMILSSGDTLIRILLLWAVFLPLGAYWKVGKHGGEKKRSIYTPVTAFVLIQVFLVYFVNLFHKLKSSEWMAGNAVETVFSLGQFTYLIGPIFSEASQILAAFNYIWIGLLIVTTFLILSRNWIRVLVTTFLILIHLMMFLTLKLGIFPLVSIVSLTLFYPTSFWNFFESKVRLNLLKGEKIFPKAERSIRLKEVLKAVKAKFSIFSCPAKVSKYLSKLIDCFYVIILRVAPILLFIGVLMSVSSSLDFISVSGSAESAIEIVDVDQSWRMFAPDPISTEAWYVTNGTLENGSNLDVFHGQEVNFSRPNRIDKTLPAWRWRKYLGNVRTADNENHYSYFLYHLCHKWNSNHKIDLENISFWFITKEVDDENPKPSREALFENYYCGGPVLQN